MSEVAARRCPICGTSLSDQAVEVSTHHRLLPCATCGLQVWDPPTAGTAAWYDASDHYLAKPLVDWLGWTHSTALALLPPDVGTLLDIGCADGRFVYAAAQRGIDAHGIDHSERLIRLGNDRHGGARLSRTSIEEFQGIGRLFDAVTLFEVIEHVPTPLELLRLAVSVARPDGLVVVSTPNRLAYPWGGHPLDRPPHHLTRWTPHTLRTAMERAGLTDVRIVLSPGGVGLKAFLLDRFRLGVAVRVLRGDAPVAGSGTSTPSGRAALVRRAILAKDRVADVAAAALAPLVGRHFAGGSMLAMARSRSS